MTVLFCLTIFSSIPFTLQTNSDDLISLRNLFSLYILLEIAFFLQSTCSATSGINVYTERFHEIGNLISRLLGSIISKVKNRISFTDVKAIIFHLRFGSNSVDEVDRPGKSVNVITYLFIHLFSLQPDVHCP